MFKRKPKKSHKNDEIYIDYSNDVDVKKTDEDEAKPEHYKALEVDDEIVVSTIQIKEAIQQKAQEEFIDRKEKDAVEAQENQLDKFETQLDTTTDKNLHIDEEQVEEPTKNILQVDDSDTYSEHTIYQDDDISEEYIGNNQEVSNDEEIDDDEEDTQRHSVYPSFLHEELSVRRNLEPIKSKSTEDNQTSKNYDEVNQELDEETLDETIDKQQIDGEDDFQEDKELQQLEESKEKKQDLHSYFQVDNSVLKKGAKKQQKIDDKESLEDQRTPLYQYKHYQFYSIEEFIIFLESNFCRLDDIADDVLKDERFFRWIKEESNQFEESIIKMRKFKQELKQ